MDKYLKQQKVRTMRIQQILEGYEKDEVKAMMMSYPEEVAKLKQTGQFDMNGQLYMDLFGYYQDEMPYGTQKARDGDPTEWLENRLSDLGMMESTNEAKCNCDCGKDPCEECGKSHHKVKEESPELARLRKLAGTEKVDELGPLAVLAPVAKAVGGALLKKGIKGAAARAGASAVASKALSNKNPQ